MLVTITDNDVLTAPEAEVRRNGNSVQNGGTDYIGNTFTVGAQVMLNWTIHNLGSASLNLTGNPRAQISTSTGCTVAVSGQPSTPISSNWYDNIGINITPTATNFTFAVSVANDDSNENPYQWTVSGNAANPALPNLRVANLLSSAPNAPPNSTVQFTAVLANDGPVAAAPVWIDLYNNRATAPGTADAWDQSAYIPSLGPNQTTNVLFSVIGPASTANWTIWVYVDRAGVVVESNENDNILSEIQVWASAPGAVSLTRISPSTPFETPVNRGVRAEARATASLPGYKYYEWRLDGELVGEGEPTGIGNLDLIWGSAKAEVKTPNRLDLTVFKSSKSLHQGARIKTRIDAYGFGTYTARIMAASCGYGEQVLSTMTLHNQYSDEISVEVFGDRPEIYFSTWRMNTRQELERTIYDVRPLDQGIGMIYIYRDKDVDGKSYYDSVPLQADMSEFVAGYTTRFLEYSILWSANAVTFKVAGQSICTIDRTVPQNRCHLYLRAWQPRWAKEVMRRPCTMHVQRISSDQGLNDEFEYLDLLNVWERNAGFYEPMKSYVLTLTVWDANDVPAAMSWQINTLPPVEGDSAAESWWSCTASDRRDGSLLILLACVMGLWWRRAASRRRLHLYRFPDSLRAKSGIARARW